MARKSELITELYHQTLKNITRNSDTWHNFLRCASYNYKLRFDEQVLLYAQRPDATAVLELDKWNRQFGRWVNKGATGIAVFDDEHNGSMRLKHYFDISDTHESRRSRTVPLWEMQEEYEVEVIETLESTFGELEDKTSLAQAIISAAHNAVEDNMPDYLHDLMLCRKDSFLEELDDFNVEVFYGNALQSSVAYLIMTRCGINADEYFGTEDFRDILNFNTPSTINALGMASSDIAEMGLIEIAATVRNLQLAERQQNRTFANQGNVSHNKDENRAERSNDDGTDIHNARRLQPPRFDRAAGNTDNPWEVRLAPQKLPERASQGDVRQPPDFGQAERTPDGDRADLSLTDGTDRGADGANAGRDGGTQSQRPDEMGWDDEQHPSGSGGNDTERPDIQLTIYPTETEQIALIGQAEDEKSSAFSISQEDIDAILQMGGIVQHGKFRIYLHFEKNMSAKDNAVFLKNEYGWGGAYPAIRDRNLDEGHDTKGIKISRGSISNPDVEVLLSWSKVAKRIGELIAADRYLSPREKEQLPAYRQWAEAEEQRRAEEAAAREILNRAPEEAVQKLPAEKENTEYRYQLGDTVFIGSGEYEILSLEADVVRLYDTAFPLLNKEYRREDFERVVQENPLNDRLIVAAKPEIEEVDVGNESIVVQVRERLDWLGYIASDAIIEEGLDEYEGDGNYIEIADFIVEEFFKDETEPSPQTLVGKRYLIDNREFVVDSVDEEWDRVSLRDVTFQNGVGFPIFRSESIEFIRMHTPIEETPPEKSIKLNSIIIDLTPKEPAEKENEPLVPSFEKQPRQRVQSFDLHPEIPMTERHNFTIVDDALGHGGAKTKFRANVDAIRTLQAIENENRYATPEEQEVLSRYVGWGGLPQAFDESNTAWTNEYVELSTLLDEEEYASARASTLNAHYTSPTVIKAIYQAVENMGFRTGNILEPACGVGNFLGLVPESMNESKLFGVELDSVTGRIAQQLYQKSSIAVQGFEQTDLPDSFFDFATGNVPFGSYGVSDKRYDKHKFFIHDYFFAKTLDKVRPGGIIAFITSKGTLDKQNQEVRKYIVQRADLLGAIRLPNNAFLANAGTQVTTDIIFLQKRDRLIDIEPDWVHLGLTDDGIPINNYFIEHPDMVLGTMANDDGVRMYGNENSTSCLPFPDADLSEQLRDAIQNIHAEITDYELDALGEDEDNSIPADSNVRNFSYTLIDGQIYFRENSRMHPVEMSVTAQNRVKGMVEIRESVRRLIEYQIEDYPDSDIQREQTELERLYDGFIKKYSLINSRANNSAFGDDSSYPLLCSLEILDENGELERKADMFRKRTINPHKEILSVDTASEALAVSLSEKALVDLPYMAQLTGKDEETLVADLHGVIFRVPAPQDDNSPPVYQTADEYLSGNVREKLQTAKMASEASEVFAPNVAALEKVQPQDLSASEISVRLGATWLPPEIVQKFMFELLDTPNYALWNVKVHYSAFTAAWNIEGKSYDSGNVKATKTYGTGRINAYKIIEETLNLKDVRIFDYVEDAEGKRTAVLNKKETTIAQQKQEAIKAAFAEWIWKDPQRRNQLVRLYNDKFNSLRPREYDGSHIAFVGINPEITLRQHQRNAVARTIYGGNSLYAHVVGAGKTFTMAAAAMESKRIGLCNKSLFVVPNHLTEQWASEFLQLYPSANILVATKKDFETKNRKKFCGRIATGDFDAVIIGHSQFERIPMSIERQCAILESQLEGIIDGIAELKNNRGDKFTIKQLEKTRKSIKLKLEKLNDQSRKDDVVTFEELGVDRLFIDEAHFYKNLFLYTKMRNVGGIAQTEAQKSSDLFMKCRYMDELTGGKGIVFATGTPISNSMVELYTMQRYLQYHVLEQNGLHHFDAWASTFGETVTAIELAPEGTGYRAKTRFAKFYNLPELMAMFRLVADIQTADMLNLPVPKANYHNIAIKPSEMQKEMVMSLSERAERVRNKMVDSHVDNMLVITNDGRKLALDERLMNDMLPDSNQSKVANCAANVYEIWEREKDSRLTQIVFCDLSTPKGDGAFNVYDDLRKKLVEMGVPADEVAFIHEASTDVQKKEMFAKVRQGKIRVLLGSTQKMGAGTNVQDKLVALHDLDCPWRPSDLEQRSGRILRQGNNNPEVDIFRYVTEQTFDAYLYQLVENKQKFIAQIMTSKSPVRSAEDVDEMALSYAEIKALATGNPFIKEKMDLDMQVAKLKVIKSSFLDQKYALEDQLLKQFPKQIRLAEERIAGYEADISTVAQNTPAEKETFPPMTIHGTIHNEKADAGKAILEACKQMTSPAPVPLGSYRGFQMELSFETFSREYRVTLKNALSHTISLGSDVHGNITRIDNALELFPTQLVASREKLENTRVQMENAKLEVQKPFPQEEDLMQKMERLNELNISLNMDKRENEMADGEPEEMEPREALEMAR